MDLELFQRARNRALELMDEKYYDPFHDGAHVQAVEKLALEIVASLPREEREKIDMELLLYGCLWHDVGRRFIKTKVLLQPFDGIIGSSIAYRELKKLGYPRAKEVRKMMRSHEAYLIFRFHRDDPAADVLADADTVEAFSPSRLLHALEKFEHGIFPRRVFLYYVIGFMMILKKKNLWKTHYSFAREVQCRYEDEIISLFLDKRERIAKFLPLGVCKRLYDKIIPKRLISMEKEKYFQLPHSA